MGKDVEKPEGPKIDARTVLGLVAILLVLLFIVQNRQQVGFDFLIVAFTVPLWFMLGGTALVMFVVGFVFGRRSTKD